MGDNTQELEIKWLGDMQRVRLGTGDTLVIRFNHPMPMEAVERTRARLQSIWPDVETLFLRGDVDIGVIESD